MEGDATNQETRLSNRSASAAISFERSRIFAVIFATVVIQGNSLGWLIGQVRPVDMDPPAKMTLAA